MGERLDERSRRRSEKLGSSNGTPGKKRFVKKAVVDSHNSMEFIFGQTILVPHPDKEKAVSERSETAFERCGKRFSLGFSNHSFLYTLNILRKTSTQIPHSKTAIQKNPKALY